MKDKVIVQVSITGAETKKTWEGTFVAKTKLTLREQLRQDEIRRVTLGMNAADASFDAGQTAGAVAYLATHIVDSPDWWKKTEGGMAAEDTNLLVEVHNAITGAITAEYEALAKEAEAAKATLQAEIAK